MGELVKAFGDFLAALLGAVGLVGRARRRANLEQDLDLMTKMEQYPEFATGTTSHQQLREHIESEVAVYARVGRKKRSWGTIFLTAALTAGLAYLTYVLNDPDFSWLSLAPGVLGFLMAISFLGGLLGEEDA